MSNSKQELFYFVDPGIGEKSAGCPYTFYQDGHDIKTFIIPPKGYELTGFKVEPYPEDTFYDGKIVAQYEPINRSFTERLKRNLVKYLLGFIIIGLVIALAFSLFKSYNKTNLASQPKLKPKTETNTLPSDKTTEKLIPETSAIIEDTVTQSIADSIAEESVGEEIAIEEIAVVEEPVSEEIVIEEIAKEAASKAVTDEIVEKVPPIEKMAEPVKQENETTTKSDNKSEQNQEEQLEEPLTKGQFQQEFWQLIHRKERHMRAYGNLYRKYKKLHLKTSEYYYLYLTILESTSAFDVWKDKLVSIPDDELKSIKSISALKQKIAEYEE